MTGIVININPVALHLGPLAIRWYGLALALALAVGLYLGRREARRRGLADEDSYAVAFWAILGGLVFARLFHAVDELDYYLRHPWEVLSLYEGGLSMWGGLVGGFLGGWLCVRKRRLPLGLVADATVAGLLAGHAIGCLGCIVNGESYGRIADLPWAFTYIHPEAMAPMLGVPTHPYPVYEIVWDLASLALLWRLRPRLTRHGLLFLGYVALYSLGRFGLGFTRQNDLVLAGLGLGQLVALVVLAVAGAFAVRLLRGAELAPAASV